LDGDAGKDVLTGGKGADSFVFTSALGAGNVDRMPDFNVAADTIKLENAGADLFNEIGRSWLNYKAFQNIGPGGAPVDANDRILYSQPSGALYYDADGSGAIDRVQFATLQNGAHLTADDFFIF
jgi:Ca2+-binding RTX toxin-like protein